MIERVDVWTDNTVTPKNPGGAIGWGFAVHVNGVEENTERGFEKPDPGNSSPRGEYLAISKALIYLIKQKMERHQVRFYSDNLMVVRQLSGLWKIKTPDAPYVKTYEIARMLARHFRDITFTWIPREANTRADALSKELFKINGIEMKEEEQHEERKEEAEAGDVS